MTDHPLPARQTRSQPGHPRGRSGNSTITFARDAAHSALTGDPDLQPPMLDATDDQCG
jgi:hypothetical protein